MTGGGVDADVAAMERLRAGDDLALNEIMARWGDPVFRYLARYLGEEAEAVDLAQETFVAVYRARWSYRPSGRFSTWVFAIATNQARQRLRWRRRHPEVAFDLQTHETAAREPSVPAFGSEDPSRQLVANERATAVRAAVLALPEDLREAVLLAEFEDLPQTEIAAILGCSAKAVESRLYRARAQLRKQLRGLL
jgi:RNA polymerase sigma-70 factor (ECF subfamily)